MQRPDAAGGTSIGARVVQVTIVLDDPFSAPQVLGRDARVTFL
jgi:hypothetical protein